MTQPNHGIIFDMDGVLIDTVTLNWQAHNEVLAEYGVHVPIGELTHYVGRALPDILTLLEHNYGITINRPAFEAAIIPIEDRLAARITPKPGVERLLMALRAAGIPAAVGTSTPRHTAILRLRTAGILSYFTAIITRDDVEEHKPNPAVYLAAAAGLELAPSRCVVIEDAPSGMEAAHSAGARCCMVEMPYVRPSARRGADLQVASLEGVTPAQLVALL